MTDLLISTCILALAAGCGTSTRFSTLDTELRERTARDELSGVVLVAEHGVPELVRAYGNVSADTCFNLASASKMFTLVAIQQLIEAGKLHRTDRLGPLIPSYAAVADVTIEQLVTHTSGLPAGIGPELFAALDKYDDLEQFVAAVAVPLELPPGTRVQYSNLGFLLLGRVVEVVSHEHYEAYVRDHILARAGMTNTGPRSMHCATPMTRGPRMPGEGVPPGPRTPFTPPRASPAGGWWSTARDLLAFTEALRSGRLVAADPVAVGFGERRWDGNRMVGHNGGAPGMNAEIWMLPERAASVIVLSNYDPPTASAIADEIVKILTGSAPPAMGGTRRMIKR